MFTALNRKKLQNVTKLSEYIWDKKSKGEDYNIEWTILGRANQYNPASKECNLCNLEKYYIVMKPELASLNRNEEIMTICRHRKQALLCNIK